MNPQIKIIELPDGALRTSMSEKRRLWRGMIFLISLKRHDGKAYLGWKVVSLVKDFNDNRYGISDVRLDFRTL